MADRGYCAVCQTNHAIANDGTPYQHNTPGTDDICPGSDDPALNLSSTRWRVYGGVVTVNSDEQCPCVVIGPIQVPEEGEYAGEVPTVHSGNDDVVLPMLGEFDHPPTHTESMALLPAAKRTPAPE